MLVEHFGARVNRAEGGTCVNGAALGANSTAADFRVDDVKRAESKAGQLVWDESLQRFEVTFRDIKPSKHDLLYLALVVPSGIHVFLHDGVVGIGKTGVSEASKGHKVTFSAPGGNKTYTEISAVEEHLVRVMNAWHGLPYLFFVAFGDGDAERILALGAKHASFLGDADEPDDDE